jgi:hypothetical protein
MRIPSGSVSQISRQSALDCSKSVSPTHRPPLTPQERFLVLISFKGCANSRPIPMTPSEIEPANFWLLVHRVAHYINEYIEYFYGLILDKNNMFPVIQHDFSVKSNCGLFFFHFYLQTEADSASEMCLYTLARRRRISDVCIG